MTRALDGKPNPPKKPKRFKPKWKPAVKADPDRPTQAQLKALRRASPGMV